MPYSQNVIEVFQTDGQAEAAETDRQISCCQIVTLTDESNQSRVIESILQYVLFMVCQRNFKQTDRQTASDDRDRQQIRYCYIVRPTDRQTN